MTRLPSCIHDGTLLRDIWLRVRALGVLVLVMLGLICVVPEQAAAAQAIEFPNGGRAEMAADGTITGMCQLVDGRIGKTYTATVVLPDGARLPAGCYESYTGVPDHDLYPGPCDGTYRFKATREGGGYFIYVYSQDAAAPAPGAIVTGPPAGYTYQHAYAKDWKPRVLLDVAFEKTSADAAFVASSGEYSLAGATYDIFEAGTDLKAGSIVTGDDGRASCKLEFGKSYYAVETAAPAGYVLSDTRVEFTAGAGIGAGSGGNGSSDGGAVALADEPVRVEVALRKTDAGTGGASQPGAALAGAVFKLVDVRGTAQEATTDSDGWARFSPIPLGAFSIVETKAPAGYKLDSTVHEYHVGSDASHVNGVVSLALEGDFPENVVAFDVELAKFKEDPAASEGGVRWPAEGVQFEIVSNTTGKVVTTLTTDAYGFARTPDGAWYGSGTRPAGVRGSLPFDSKGYLVREVASTVPEGYERMDDFTIEAKEQVDGVRLKYIIENKTPAARLQIVKTDAASGHTVPLAGFTFRLLDADGKPVEQDAWYPNHVSLCEFSTDETGGVTLPEQLVPGAYSIEEVRAQAPYLLGDELVKVELGGDGGSVAVVRFADEQATGRARLEKRDAETGEALAGAAFDVVAQELIASPDGTVQAVAGEIVAQVETDADGVATVDGLALGDGSAVYAFVETRAPAGYVLDSTPHEFEVTYADDETPVVETLVEVTNAPTEVVVAKVDEQSGEPLEGVSFAVREVDVGVEEALEPEEGAGSDADGDSDASIVVKTGVDGTALWKRLAPGDYVLVETETLPGYVRDESERAFSIDETGAVVGGGEDGCFTINNDYTKVEISKRDITGEQELAGAHLTLFDAQGEVVEQWVSTDEPHRIDRLEPGAYVLREERTPATHDVADDVPFEVLETGEIQRVVMHDAPIEVSGEIDKRQEIALPVAEDAVANGDGCNRVEARASEDGAFDYALDWRNTSNTWVDEFTVTDTLLCCSDGLAMLDGVTTPVAEGDYDGKLNVWYLTNLSDGAATGDEVVSATRSDGHANPWLQDEAAVQQLGADGRVLPFEGWRLWAEGVSSTEASELSVDELGLTEGEVVTALRFEYGRVDQGFTTRADDWDRDGLKDLHDDVERVADGDSEGDDGEGGCGTEGALAPAILHMRATDAYRAETVLHNVAQVDLYRNGGGEGLEDHDSDEVEQTAGDTEKPIPVKPHADIPQTGDGARVLVAVFATAGMTAVVAGLAGRRRR